MIMKITEEQRELLEYKISEGLIYAFIDYSNWNDIADEEFQKQKTEFVQSVEKFKTYLNQQGLIEN